MSSKVIQLGSCEWNGNEVVQTSESQKGVAGLAPDSPVEWGPIFAAAPDMLNALEGILVHGLDAQWIDGGAKVGEARIESWRNEARKAIAKARGDAS